MARILLVDDDPGVMQLLDTTLTRAGHAVTACADGAAARDAATATVEPFDLIVTDFRLGEGTGLDLVARLRDDGVTARCILVTGDPSVPETHAATLRALACDHVLGKPFRPSDLRAAVTAVMDR